MVAEASGGWGPTAEAVLQRLAALVAAKTGRDPGAVAQEHHQQLCTVIRKAKAQAVLRRVSCELDELPRHHLAAREALTESNTDDMDVIGLGA